MSESEKHRPIRSFVLRAGRMTPAQQRGYDEGWTQFGLDYDGKRLNIDEAFGRSGRRVLEIDRQPHGDVLLYQALANSYNLATARLGMNLGIPTVVDMLRRLGITGDIPAVPALMLGAGEYSPMMMAAMYQSIAAGGFRQPLRSIRDVVDANGEPLSRYALNYERTVGIEPVHLLQYGMRAVVQEGTGRGVYRYLPSDFAVAGKTGTTNDGRDSWFAGFSGDRSLRDA